MKIAFVQNFSFEYLGIMSISAFVKQNGHETRVFINGWEKNLDNSLTDFNPDVIAFPTYSGSQGWVFQKARELKKKFKKLIVLGGPHATFAPEIIYKKGVDVVCRGEGEYPILELLDALEKGKSFSRIPNLWVKKGNQIIKNSIRPLINPLDKLPFLDREIYYRYPTLAKSASKNFNIGRGCPFNCAYCHNSGLTKIYRGLGLYVRAYQPRRVVAEIVQLKKQYPLATVHFVDDIFIFDRKWLNKFLPLYKKRVGLPFVCNIRGGLLDANLAKKLSQAGCLSVFLGVETGNEQLRILILKKFVNNVSLKKTAALIHRYHIRLAANNMVGLPGETVDQAIETIKLNSALKVDLPWCAIFQPYPGTELADYCLAKGFVNKRDLEKIGVFFHKESVIHNPQIKELVRLHKLFHLGVWWPGSIPVIRILIKLPLDPFYQLVFLFNQGLTWMRFSDLSLGDFVPDVVTFTQHYFGWQK